MTDQKSKLVGVCVCEWGGGWKDKANYFEELCIHDSKTMLLDVEL